MNASRDLTPAAWLITSLEEMTGKINVMSPQGRHKVYAVPQLVSAEIKGGDLLVHTKSEVCWLIDLNTGARRRVERSQMQNAAQTADIELSEIPQFLLRAHYDVERPFRGNDSQPIF
jgi:hypothetical protein